MRKRIVSILAVLVLVMALAPAALAAVSGGSVTQGETVNNSVDISSVSVTGTVTVTNTTTAKSTTKSFAYESGEGEVDVATVPSVAEAKIEAMKAEMIAYGHEFAPDAELEPKVDGTTEYIDRRTYSMKSKNSNDNILIGDDSPAIAPQAVNGGGTEYYMEVNGEYGAVAVYTLTLAVEYAGPGEYSITAGAGQTYTIGADESLTVTADGALADLAAVLVDGAPVAKEHYDAASGSTVLTLKKAYLDTLAEGSHTLAVAYKDGGKAETAFTVKMKAAAPSPSPTPSPAPSPKPAGPTSPNTGVETAMPLWAVLVVTLAAGGVCLAAARKKEN